jgi:hypothetical protein
MIKIKVKSNTGDEYIREVQNNKYIFLPLKNTARNEVLKKHVESGKLYARVMYNADPIHHFSNGDLLKVNSLEKRMLHTTGIDCSKEHWIGANQHLLKSDVQLLLLKEVKLS